MFHPDEHRTDTFELYDQPAADLAEAKVDDLVHRHARIVVEDGHPQARFRKVIDRNTVWADDPHTREVECFEETQP